MKRRVPMAVMALVIGVAVNGVQAATVGLIKIDGAIGPATADYISRAIDLSAGRRDECLIIQLDTPGGLLDSTKVIVQKFYVSPVPTVVFVAPASASAGSAGTFITMAADIAAMAPHTRIGAAHPVAIGMGGDGETKPDDVMKAKMENDAAGFIETIARKRQRNVEWARSAVVSSVVISAEKALELKVIDLIADDVADLLGKIDGRKVGDTTLRTKGAAVAEIRMSPWEWFSKLFLRPEVMFILMLVAIYGIVGELSNPGAVLPGVAGAIALILVLYMAAILPVNVAGLALIGLAIALFIADVYAPSHGVLTVGGVVSFFLGALMLFNHAEPGFRLSLSIIIPATAVTALFFTFVIGAGLRAQSLPVRAGRETMLGQVVPALERIDATAGKVFIEGELWNAVSDRAIEKDRPVEVVGIEGLTLKVREKPTT